MQEHLFKMNQFANISAAGKLDAAKIQGLAQGASLSETIALELTIAGVSQTVNAAVKIVKLSDKQLLAFTQSPVLVKASEFKLEGGIQKLQELAGLKRIEQVVPVTFSVQFNR